MSRPRTTAGCRSDAEILTDFAKMVALRALLDDLAQHPRPLENGTAPAVPALPEADASDMDYFVAQLQIALPVLGVNAIRVPLPNSSTPAPGVATESPVFRLRNTKGGVDAQAQQIDGEFTMLAGSFVVTSWHGVGKAESTMKAYASY